MKSTDLKTHVLLFAREFMKGHPKAGKQTNFKQKIIKAEKIHTIRSNYEYWAPKVQEVAEGKARLSLRYWRGKPYRSKQQEFWEVLPHYEPSVQKIEIDEAKVLTIDGKYFWKTEFVAQNDGLTETDFLQWFNDLPFEGAIIHFTDFRY